MSNIRKMLSDRIREVYLNGHWIANTNFKEEIQNITWYEATVKIDSFNTIAAITFHINYYISGIIKAMDTGKLEIHDKYSYDITPIKSDEDWKSLVDEFLSHALEFAIRIENMDESTLDKPFFDEKYGNYLRNIEGVIEHSYYHLGQIVLIKKSIVHRTNNVN